MNTGEVSAFAAYSANKVKKKHGSIGLSIKSKHKMKKKKRKSHEKDSDSAFISLIKATESNDFGETDGKNEEMQVEKKKLIKDVLRAEKKSIFKLCNPTTKVDNVFLEENGLSSEDSSQTNKKEKKIFEDSIKLKKSKKRKLVNGVHLKTHKNIHHNGSIQDEIRIKKSSSAREEIFTLGDKSNTDSLSIIYSDSVKVGEKVFSWMLNPVDVKEFFNEFWEKKPCYIEHGEDYFKSVCTMEDFKTALSENEMYFSKNIDVTSYVNGRRTTENPEGLAKPLRVWSLYREGKSIRLLNPQTFIPSVRSLNSALQEFFQCFVGANIYLTPPGTQGFAPHYDDIDAFVLQLEGEKYWKLYNPRSPEEVLPRESSINFSEDEIGEPIFEVTLKPGDLLYFPRGIIHQAKCLPHSHSLHITVSCCQKVTWADLLEKVLPVALQKAVNENVELRKSLPMGYLNHVGMVHFDQESSQRRELIRKFEELAKTVLDCCPIDAGFDQVAAGFVHDALPPCLTREEKLYGADRNVQDAGKSLLHVLKNYPDKNLGVKLIRATCVRLVSEGEETILYYTTDNTLVYRENEVFSVSVSTPWAQAIERLIHAYPKFVEMKELPVSHKLNKPGKWNNIAELVCFLCEKGLLLFDRPFQALYSQWGVMRGTTA